MDKNRLKSIIYASEVRIATGIAGIVYNRASKRDALRLIRKEIDRIPGLSDVERNQMWIFGVNFYRHSVAGAGRKVDESARAEALYAVLRKDNLRMEEMKNSLADEIEYRRKHAELIDLMSDPGNRWFQSTVLKDCASDHKPFQGKFYYRKDGKFSEEELKFIAENGIMSVDDVLMKPPYLCTRRNCRHKLFAVPFSSVKTGDLGHEFSYKEISYEEGQYHFYRDRLKMMVAIKKQFNGNVPELLKSDIRRTRRLVLDWYRASK